MSDALDFLSHTLMLVGAVSLGVALEADRRREEVSRNIALAAFFVTTAASALILILTGDTV